MIVAQHTGKDLQTGTIGAIIKQAGLTVDEFKDLL